MSKNRQQDLFSADIPLATELNEAGLTQTSGGATTANFSKRIGNRGRFCTLTKECQNVCRWF